MPSFIHQLREQNRADWTATVQHRFVDEIFRGAVDPQAMRRYLVQDYQFIDRFTALVGAAIAFADRFDSRIRFAQFAAMITSDENTYFQRAFDALGVPAQERDAPTLSPVTAAFQELMHDAAQSRDYGCCLAVLSVAEGIYLDWADRPGAALPPDFLHAEWITLHNNDGFRAFVGWLHAELDRVGDTLSTQQAEVVGKYFTRAVQLERAFFDHIFT
ncbi:TenA family protein [Ancylobacter lacus]|uniref:TenA family protein n=1 Tax=Ancylobacter lacus TaxID=2579970 RepID=UPI001BCFBE3A|nr:TenA family protein [Ancylobacter lacus]MBS7539021.1 TenA family protein [Ancylobacter lacus]